jgi:hypothetical protein
MKKNKLQKTDNEKLTTQVSSEQLTIIWDEVRETFKATEKLVSAATLASVEAVKKAIECGRALNEAKAKAGHGNWEKMFAKETKSIKGCSLRYAQDLMALAKFAGKVDAAFLRDCKSVRHAMVLCGIIPEPAVKQLPAPGAAQIEAPSIDAEIVSEDPARYSPRAMAAQDAPEADRPHIQAGPVPETPAEALERGKAAMDAPAPGEFNGVDFTGTGEEKEVARLLAAKNADDWKIALAAEVEIIIGILNGCSKKADKKLAKKILLPITSYKF